MLLGGTWKVSWTVLKEHSNLSNSYLFASFFLQQSILCNDLTFGDEPWHKDQTLSSSPLDSGVEVSCKALNLNFSACLRWAWMNSYYFFFYFSVKFNFLSGVDEVKNLNHGLQIRPRTRSRFLLIFSYFGWKFLQNCIWNEQNSRMIRNVNF